VTLADDFLRVTRRRPCPVCGRIKYCMVGRDCPTDPRRVICTKIESPRKWRDAGWFHSLGEGCRPPTVPRVRTVTLACCTGDPKFASLAAQFTSNLASGAADRLAGKLGLTGASLHRLGLGWASAAEIEAAGTGCRSGGCWSFPMQDGKGNVVGIRLRTPDSFKYSLAGGRQGLHIPAELPTGQPLLLAEGPTDTAALLDLGFAAIGRPSCRGGERAIVALLPKLKPPVVVVVSDSDEPGLRGARSLASVLAAYHRDVRVVRPPDGVKDARAWKGASPDPRIVTAQINTVIAAAPRVRTAVTTGTGGR